MSPALLRRVMNFWPPLLGAGIRVQHITPDWRDVEVRLRARWWNRNANGVMFGGSLFAMTDPWFPLMLHANLGRDYVVASRSGQISFEAPGLDLAIARFSLSEEQIEAVRSAAANGARTLPSFDATVTDPEGKILARVTHVVYVRRKPSAAQRAG